MIFPRIGLALGGGGARGAAHIGALKVLHAEGISFDQVAGTSAGAVIGAMYGATRDPEWIEQRFRAFIESDVFKELGTDRLVENRDPHSAFEQIARKVKDQVVLAMSLHRSSIIRKDRLRDAFNFLIPVKTFEELQIPLKVVATDIQSATPVIYESGDLLEAVVQSGTIPGYVEPTKQEEKLIVDGGASMPLPTPVLKDTVDFLIGIDIRKRSIPPLEDVNIYEIMLRSDMVTYLNLTREMRRLADFVIDPDVKNLHWSRFDKFDELLNIGIQAAESSVKSLKKRIKQKSRLKFKFKHWFDLLT